MSRPTARQVVKQAMRLPVAHRFRLAWWPGRSPRVPLGPWGRALPWPLAMFTIALLALAVGSWLR
jgi:hypothetical protein